MKKLINSFYHLLGNPAAWLLLMLYNVPIVVIDFESGLEVIAGLNLLFCVIDSILFFYTLNKWEIEEV